MKRLAQGHTANKWNCKKFNPCISLFKNYAGIDNGEKEIVAIHHCSFLAKAHIGVRHFTHWPLRWK